MVQDQDFDFYLKTDILKTLVNIGPDPGTTSLKAKFPQPLCPLDRGDNALPGPEDTSESTLCNTDHKGNNVAASWRKNNIIDLNCSNNLNCSNQSFLQEQNISMSYDGDLRTNNYYAAIRRKVNVFAPHELPKPQPSDTSKSLSFDLDQRGQI